MSETETDFQKVSYVLASKPREDTLEVLGSGFATPSEIETEVGHQIAHVSRALRELREKDLVELLVEEDTHKGRLYGLTQEGQQIQTAIEER